MNYINHIAIVLDASSSMIPHTQAVIQVTNNQVAHLAQRSKELDQETRITLYKFADTVECLVYDKDVLRMPDISKVYKPYGNTALCDATVKALDDLSKTPELYGDHAFLAFVITDGEENIRTQATIAMPKRLTSLPANWTAACFVPDQAGVFEAKRLGFPAGNVAVWDTKSHLGVKEVGQEIRKATETFMTNRSTGTRGYTNLFNIGAAVATADISSLAALHPGQYRMLEAKERCEIAPFVERSTGRPYKLGEAFYQLVKREKIQPAKELAIMDKKTRRVYSGKNARLVLGLPDHEVKTDPAGHGDYDIYVQSTSVNRKLIPGQKVMIVS